MRKRILLLSITLISAVYSIEAQVLGQLKKNSNNQLKNMRQN